MSKAPIDRSNSLADLAHRIRAEHEAFIGLAKKSLEVAIRAGDLLLEAKEQLPHGQWLPWLQEHCQVSERSCQRYMLLARHAPELRANTTDLADLTADAAMKLLAPPPSEEPDWDDLDSMSAWVERLLDGPFTNFDVPWSDDDKDLDINLDWVTTKLMHQAKMPWTAQWCFSVKTEDGRPPLRCCPWDDLLEAIKALAPIASGKRALKFDFADIRSMQAAISVVQIEAQWMLGGVLNEMQDREHMSDERYEQEWEQQHAEAMAVLEREIAKLGAGAA